jgi:hypothetical protein
LLIALAQHAFGSYAQEIEQQLLVLVHADGEAAQRALIVATEAIEEIVDSVPGLEEERVERVIDLARLLVHSTLLWVPVTEEEGSRQIIKLGYDEPVRRRLVPVLSLLTAFSFRSHIEAFEVGQAGDAGSYHLEINVPFPLEILNGTLVIEGETPRPSLFGRLREGADASLMTLEHDLAALLGRHPPRPILIDKRNYPQRFTRRVHFYASGHRSRSATAVLWLAPERRGVPLVGALIGLFVAGALTALETAAADLYANAEVGGVVGGTVALLLLGPTLVGYVLTQPGEQLLATRILSGTRALTVGSVLLAVGAAGVLVAALALQSQTLLGDILPWLVKAAWIAAGVLFLGLLMPRRRRSSRLD